MIRIPTEEEVAARKEKFRKRSGKRKPAIVREFETEKAIRKLGNATIFYLKFARDKIRDDDHIKSKQEGHV